MYAQPSRVSKNPAAKNSGRKVGVKLRLDFIDGMVHTMDDSRFKEECDDTGKLGGFAGIISLRCHASDSPGRSTSTGSRGCAIRCIDSVLGFEQLGGEIQQRCQ
jgi:hypothetical protein